MITNQIAIADFSPSQRHFALVVARETKQSHHLHSSRLPRPLRGLAKTYSLLVVASVSEAISPLAQFEIATTTSWSRKDYLLHSSLRAHLKRIKFSIDG